MERLTERNKNSLAMAACCGKECEYNYVCEVGGFGECRGMDDIIDRLADIEDILGDDYDLDRLRELVEADRDGRCVVLTPAKQKDKETLFDALSEAVSSWGDMSKGEKALADSILAAMKGDCHE